MAHASVDEGIIYLDDSPLGEHSEHAFIRGTFLHHPDPEKLRKWLLWLLREKLDRWQENVIACQGHVDRIAAQIENLDREG